MAITILNSPATDVFIAAAAPVWVRGETDAAETAYTITSIADASGSVSLVVADSTGCIANNVLLITGCTVDYAYLNGRWNVAAVPDGTHIVINSDYSAASTGTPGIATIQLEKWAMGIDLEYVSDGDDYTIGTHYIPFQNDIATKDISRAVCGIFQSAFSLTDGWASELDKGIFYIQMAVYEAALDAAYARQSLDSEVLTWYAVRSANITGRVLETGYQNKLLNGTTNVKVHAGTKVIMSALTTESDVSAYYSYNVGATNTNNTVAFTTDNFKGNFVFTPVANSTGIQLFIKDSAGDRISEILTVTLLPGTCAGVYPLYFLNHYGGYDVYEFIDATETNAKGNRSELRGFATLMGNLIDKDFSTESWEEVLLTGRPEPQSNLTYLRDLLTSSEIYNAAGERVKLLSAEFITSSRENTTPEISILVNRGNPIW
ncbi:MAG: hypothetical protein IPN08_09670 [Bacteroidales bacterium]|nr:hypothetical protein [Bacteroidales bacterium]